MRYVATCRSFRLQLWIPEDEAMKIVVVGIGAMGSIYAALLADAGHEVWALEPWAEHANAIRLNGLRVQGASGDRLVSAIKIVDTIDDVGSADLFVIATKASSVAAAARMIAPVLTSESLVLTIQNGLGAGERIAQYLPAEQVLLGVAEGFGASIKSPGHIVHTAMKMIRIGSMTADKHRQVEAIAELWREAGFNTSAYQDIEQLIWEKFICNVAYSAPCTVFGKNVKDLLDDPHAKQISQTCATEAWEVAVRKKINLSFDNPIEYITAFGHKVGDARPSMLLDHMAKRPSEIDAINGMVPVVAEQAGLSAPFNSVLTGIVLSRESAWQHQ